MAQSETLTEHKHQVLHVSFAHDGTQFATCSKDGYILVWTAAYPAKVRHSLDMKTYSWKYTQYSQFNRSDTLLLVSGVHFGTPHSTSGEIAVFSLDPSFQLQCRVVNKPYDIFGAWYSDRYLISGELHWLAHLVSSSLLWLNKASQESDSEHTPITSQLYRFYNRNASTVRAVMVADCLTDEEPSLNDTVNGNTPDQQTTEHGNPPSHRDIQPGVPQQRIGVRMDLFPNCRPHDALEYARPFGYNCDYRKATAAAHALDDSSDDDSQEVTSTDGSSGDGETGEARIEEDFDLKTEKYLIFTTGSKTYTPHQIGFKRMKAVSFPKRLEPGPSLKERLALRARAREMRDQMPEPNWLNFESVADKFDKVDHLIDLHGHIIGMALSPDHRYLYVNSRPWPTGYIIGNPLEPPPIAQEIDIHVIDLVTLKEVGRMLRAHKAYTPNNECFFIFLDVCEQYVASGAEDRHGYLWDRHYGVCLAKFPHSDVVNSVAFNPKDPEMLVTTSDDETVKVWRSRARLREHSVDPDALPQALEVRKVHREQRRRRDT